MNAQKLRDELAIDRGAYVYVDGKEITKVSYSKPDKRFNIETVVQTVGKVEVKK